MNTKKQNKKKKGFTLIELIIVIAIIAILAAIAIPNFLSIQRKAKVKADVASAKTIYDATSALIAEGQIIAPGADKTITLTLNADGIVNGGDGKDDPSTDPGMDAQDLQNYLQTIPLAQSVDKGIFKVTITGPESKPVIQVDINDKNIYPTADSEYALNK
ncbi:prepilin-type N-terminal cleavage/methylation domain-containing protein [Clostridium sp. LIBA-8841]|uniref:prepilin-type N-terminal cleavage/methylation domain-containing protein n=1 Tax=Clostridium sp. LIBA-8841 TaxID=2987530 RepID=UPI002AC7845B|nr:prepilin-type N-terminal cleavage/methylation domain-containing protein [Clostridium sp. LIBA-8841]MDZ5255065.1 prepilin-type N-terminal cleavage/methylation domain-containing protein [Clostridium sp. LIBA-8841]